MSKYRISILNVLLYLALVFIANFVPFLVSAEDFKIGAQLVKAPSPKGFSLVTPKMSEIYKISRQMEDPYNDQLAFYIEKRVLSDAISGKIPFLDRYCILKVDKELGDVVMDASNFNKYKDYVHEHHKDISKLAEQELNIDLSQDMTSLAPHYTAKDAVAYSMYLKNKQNPAGESVDYVQAVTQLSALVSGKLLSLYCYAKEEELEWTRKTTKNWSVNIIASNPKSYASSSRLYWFETKALSGAIVGGAVALIFGLVVSITKRKK